MAVPKNEPDKPDRDAPNYPKPGDPDDPQYKPDVLPKQPKKDAPPKPSGPGTTSKKPGPGLGSAGSMADVDTTQPRAVSEFGTAIDPILDREVNLADWDPRLPPHGTPIARPDPGRPYPEDGERGVPWTLPPSLEGSVEAFPVGATARNPTGDVANKGDADVASKPASTGKKPADVTR